MSFGYLYHVAVLMAMFWCCLSTPGFDDGFGQGMGGSRWAMGGSNGGWGGAGGGWGGATGGWGNMGGMGRMGGMGGTRWAVGGSQGGMGQGWGMGNSMSNRRWGAVSGPQGWAAGMQGPNGAIAGGQRYWNNYPNYNRQIWPQRHMKSIYIVYSMIE